MSVDTTAAEYSDWRQLGVGLKRQQAVVMALVFKEFKQRLGRSRIGFLWLLVEPIVHMSLLSGIWYVAGRHSLQGVHVTLFLSTGIACYFFFRRGLTAIPMAITSNQALLSYPQVKPIDTVIARFILDVVITTLAGLIMLGVLYWFFDIEMPVPYPLAFAGVFIMTLAFSFGLGLTLCYFVTIYPTVQHIMSFIGQPLYFASGILFPVHSLPADLRWYIYCNPVVHLVDLWRYTLLGLKMAPEADLLYPALWTILLLGMGSLIYYANRYKLIEK